jgi:hypothetical protein
MRLRSSRFERWYKEHGGVVNKAFLESVGRAEFASLDGFVNEAFRSPQSGAMLTGGLDELWSLLELARDRGAAESLQELARTALPDAGSEQRFAESLATVFAVPEAARDGRLARVSRLMLAQDFIRRVDSDELRPVSGLAPSQVNDHLQAALEATSRPAGDVPPPAGADRRMLQQAARYGGQDGDALLEPAGGAAQAGDLAAAAVEAMIDVNEREGAISEDEPDPVGASNGVYDRLDALLSDYRAVLPEELGEEASRKTVAEQTADMASHAGLMEAAAGEPEDRPFDEAVQDMELDLESMSAQQRQVFLTEGRLDEAGSQQLRERRASRRATAEDERRDESSTDEAPPFDEHGDEQHREVRAAGA